jgi:hypothetical protein
MGARNEMKMPSGYVKPIGTRTDGGGIVWWVLDVRRESIVVHPDEGPVRRMEYLAVSGDGRRWIMAGGFRQMEKQKNGR